MARRDRAPVPFRPSRRPRARAKPWRKSVSPIVVMLPLGAFTAMFLWGGPPAGLASAPADAAVDRESAQFALCGEGARRTCVVDGDTFWYRGDKIRIADINTPEVSEPQCAREGELGRAATGRLLALLNAGPFTLGPNADGRDHDTYGRLLRVVTREGESLGQVLVREGLAEEWQGSRGSWC